MTVITARQFSVDEIGAYVTELYDTNGHPVLFPRTLIGNKNRGGSHICFPYFGPDAADVRPQHGFGRTVTWRSEVSVDGRIVTCAYDEVNDERFQGLSTKVKYEINEAGDTFTTTLNVINNGSQSSTVTPGFHPYFMIDATDVVLNGKRINVADFDPFQSFPDTTSIVLETAGRTVTVLSENLTHMVVWTDAKGEYLCIEPTVRGNAFDSRHEPRLSGIVPGGTIEYSFSIKW